MGLFGGGSKSKSYSQQSSSSQYSPGVWSMAEPYMKKFYEFATQASQQAPQYYQGDTLAKQSPWTQEGQTALGQAGRMQDYQLGQAMPAWQQALNATDIANNQQVQGMASAMRGSMGADFDSAVRRLNQNMTQVALPAARSGAALRGGIGGSRQALAEAVAMRENQGQMADFRNQQTAQHNQALADLYNQSYNTGVGARTAALGMTGAMQQAAGAGADTRLRAGGLQEARQQQEIDADRERFEYYRDYPARMAQLYGSLFSSANVPFGTVGSSKSSGTSYGSQKQSGGFDLGGLLGAAAAFMV